MKAPDTLKRAAQHMEDRATARDQPEGERSMPRCVAAFNALTGHRLSERDGWLFMAVLKAARAATTPTGISDDYEDGAAYFGLAGEAAMAAPVASGKRGAEAPELGLRPVRSERFVAVGGVEFNVPAGYNYVAQDANGQVWAFTHVPVIWESPGYWWKPKDVDADMCELGVALNGEPWRQSLITLAPN